MIFGFLNIRASRLYQPQTLPSSSVTVLDRGKRNSSNLCPFGSTFPDAINFYRCYPGPIAALSLTTSPSAILFRISLAAVDAVKRSLLRPRPHITQEIGEFSPLFANRKPFPAVISVGYIFRVCAALPNVKPRMPFRRSTHSVFSRKTENVSVKTTAASCPSTNYGSFADGFLNPAITAEKPFALLQRNKRSQLRKRLPFNGFSGHRVMPSPKGSCYTVSGRQSIVSLIALACLTASCAGQSDAPSVPIRCASVKPSPLLTAPCHAPREPYEGEDLNDWIILAGQAFTQCAARHQALAESIAR